MCFPFCVRQAFDPESRSTAQIKAWFFSQGLVDAVLEPAKTVDKRAQAAEYERFVFHWRPLGYEVLYFVNFEVPGQNYPVYPQMMVKADGFKVKGSAAGCP